MNQMNKKLADIEKSVSQIIKNMTTKSDIKTVRGQMKTLESQLRNDLRGMATKDDIRNMATKDDLRGMTTKTDLKNLEVRILGKIDESQMEIIATVDKHKADKETVGILEKRVDRLENNADLPPFIDQ